MSEASRKILPMLLSGRATSNFQMQLMVKDLRLAAGLGMNCGAPMLISNAVRNLYEVGANELGGTAGIDDMSRLYEAMSDVCFAGN